MGFSLEGNNQELLIVYGLLNPFCCGALPSLGLPRILAQ